MRIRIILSIILSFTLFSNAIFAQDIDSAYIESYSQKIRLMGFVGTDFIQIRDNGTTYTPNIPLAPGLGVSIKNTVVNVRLGYGLFALNNKKKYGKTKSFDLQIHNYWKDFILDLSFQQYKGFYSRKEDRSVGGIYPNLSVLQAGGELAYVFSGNKFSSKTAFDLGEIQRKSAGSFLLSADAYFYCLEMDKNNSVMEKERSNNLQLGIKAGYGYSWVLDKYWLLSAMGMVGGSFGNDPEALKKGNIKVYPTASGRFGSSYHRDNWAAGLSVLVGNKQVYVPSGSRSSLTSVGMQLSYVLYIDRLFKK